MIIYSTDEFEYNKSKTILLDNWIDCNGESLDLRGKTIRLTGEFMYEGTNQKTILLQIGYTKPVDYPYYLEMGRRCF